MAENSSFANAADGLADTNSLIVDGSGAGTGSVNVTEFGATGAANVYKEIDTAGDSSWAVSVQIDSGSGTWHAQGNDLIASQSQNMRIRVENTSGGAIDAYISGYEVTD